MHIIYTPADIDAVIDPPLRTILERYRDLLDLCVIYEIQPNDTVATLQAARGRPFELWEFIHDHGGLFEAVFVLSDFGEGHVVIVPDSPTIDAELLTLCRQNATKPDI
jgi:hypothetical protein